MFIYVFVFVQVHIYIYIYMCVSVFLPVCINVYVGTYVYTYMREFMCMLVCFYVYACAFGSVSVNSLRVIIPLSSLIFQEIHPQVPLTTSSVMFFQISFGVSGLSALYTSTKVTQLVLISHQLVDRNLTAAKKKKKKITKNSMRLYGEYLQRNIQSNMCPGNYFPIKKCVAGTEEMVSLLAEKLIVQRLTLTLRTD